MTIDAERWLPVVGYEGIYEVSDMGNVRRVQRTFMGPRGPQTLQQRAVKPQKSRGGHLRVGLYKPRDGVKHQTLLAVHRLVLIAFIGDPPEGCIGCHNNGDPEDNRLVNLRWDTPRENNLDTVRHGHNRHSNKTHCKHGHPLSGANLYRTEKGRYCRACRNAAQKRYLRRRGETA